MTEQAQSIKEAAVAFSSMVRRVLIATRAEVLRQREMARARADQREAQQASERQAFETAMVRFENLLIDMLSNYRPTLTQEEVNKVTWETPDPVAGLLEEEIHRIRSILRPLMRDAGFPLGTKNKVLDNQMDGVWERAHAAFHQKAFGHLILPSYFSFQENGTLNYEPIFWEKEFMYEGYVGRYSRHRYSNDRVLAPVSS